MKISELFLTEIPFDNPKRKKQDLKCVAISQELAVKDYKPTKRFEVDVLNYLFENKASLGIETLWKFTAGLIDGAIVLDDGRLVALEMKYAMNWFTNVFLCCVLKSLGSHELGDQRNASHHL
jgi:hypothetical protein